MSVIINEIIEKLLDKPIAFQRIFVDMTGNVQSALMLSQAYYWSKRTTLDDGWFYKTSAEWTKETGLSRHEQDTARKHLRKTSFWKEKLSGVPATCHFKIDKTEFFGSLLRSGNQVEVVVSSQQTKLPLSGKHSTTETTTETTSTESKDSVSKKPEFIIGEWDMNSKPVELPNTKVRAKKEKKPADESYTDFVEIWCKAYPDLGFDGISGVKINSIIKRTRERITTSERVPTRENMVAAFNYVLEYVKRENHWIHGKPITTFDQHYNSVVREIKEGKPKKDIFHGQNSASRAFGKYGHL